MSPLVRLLLKVKTLNTIKAIPTSAEWSLFRFSTLRCVVGFKTRSRQKKRSFYPKRNLKFLICKNKSLVFVHHSGKHQNCLFTEIQIRSFSSAHCSLKIFQLKGYQLRVYSRFKSFSDHISIPIKTLWIIVFLALSLQGS